MNAIAKMFVGLHVRLFRATNGRFGSSMGGNKMLLLTTTGNVSGRERTVPVMVFEDAGRRFVIASANGSTVHPAWYKNLAKTPDVKVEARGEGRYAARAETLTGEERARVYQIAVRAMGRFAEYEKRAVGREIPVVELKRA